MSSYQSLDSIINSTGN